MRRRRSDTKDLLVAIAVVIGTVGLIVLLIVGLYQRHKMIKKCTDNGGQWIKYNCRMITSMHCSHDDKGHLEECHLESYEQCDEKCVGANAEAHE